MSIKIINGGLMTTIQDYGRIGFQRFGFHVSGAMDKRAYAMANLLLGNKNREAVLEFCLMGPTIEFTEDAVVCITGGDFSPKLNNCPVDMYQAIAIKRGDQLSFSYASDGTWGYVGFAGGIEVPVVMGSRSTDIKSQLGGLNGRRLMAGDNLMLGKNVSELPLMERRKAPKPTYKKNVTRVRVVLGPQDDYFTSEGMDTFLHAEYTVSNECDRMGYRLEGSPITHNEKGADIISDGIAFGSIQVPKKGLPIVVLADRQTTGGYTKIATVIGVDIPDFVQRRPGEKVIFEAVSPNEAQRLYLEEEDRLDALRRRLKKPKKLFRRLFGHK